MTTITLRIPDDLREHLEELSRREQRPSSELVRESLRQYLAQVELRLLREKLRPYAEASGYLTDEDVFKAVS